MIEPASCLTRAGSIPISAFYRLRLDTPAVGTNPPPPPPSFGNLVDAPLDVGQQSGVLSYRASGLAHDLVANDDINQATLLAPVIDLILDAAMNIETNGSAVGLCVAPMSVPSLLCFLSR